MPFNVFVFVFVFGICMRIVFMLFTVSDSLLQLRVSLNRHQLLLLPISGALQCSVIRQLESRSSNSRLVAVIKAQSLGTAGDRKTQNTGYSYDFQRVESETTHF